LISTIVASLDIPGAAIRVAIAGSHAHLRILNSLHAIDLLDPTSPLVQSIIRGLDQNGMIELTIELVLVSANVGVPMAP
jgi:hypothetical protein